MNPFKGRHFSHVIAPTYQVHGSNVNNVGDAIDTLQTKAPVQYSNDKGQAAPKETSNDVTLVGRDSKKPVGLHNVDKGRAATDAVNVEQLNDTYGYIDQGDKKTEKNANQYSDFKYQQSIDYSNNKYGELKQSVDWNKKQAEAGIAGATAIASIPYIHNTDFSLGVGVGTFRGGNALATGMQKKLTDNSVARVNASWDTAGNANLGAGLAVGW